MSPPRGVPVLPLSGSAAYNSENKTPKSSSPSLRRSPRILASTSGKVSKPFRSPIISKSPPAVASLGKQFADIKLPDVGIKKPPKRPPTEAITPLRNSLGTSSRPHPTGHNENCPTPRRAPPHTVQAEFDFCGLPLETQQLYKEKRRINELYDWQKECLSDNRVLDGQNVIVSLPTGAGKTLVAEVLMLREAICNHRSSILVLPYVAIVQEKIGALAIFEEAFGVHIEEYAASKGRLPPIKRRTGRSIYVATIEKANMLMNALIETNRLDDIGLVVIDELHMIGDGLRGALIEQTIVKYLHRGVGQIVGMSATLSNMEDLARFMKAFVYSTTFRPVELLELVRIGQQMNKVEPDGRLVYHHDLPPNPLASRDPDGICQLLHGTIPAHSAIIFCPTKKNCENVAVMIAKAVPKQVRELHAEKRQALVAIIREEGEGKSEELLEKCVLAGIAWHHSGLTHDERKHIEAAYVEGVLCVICATSTLAAGVNLPARKVIIKAPMVGRDRLKKSQYTQMIGRAGRKGFDERGESVTIIRSGTEERCFRDMLQNEEMRCVSALGETTNLSSFVLDAFSLDLADSRESLSDLLSLLLLTVQRGREEVEHLAEMCIGELKKEGLLEEDTDKLKVTEVGAATFGANIVPEHSTLLRKDLMESLHTGLVFSSHLHLLFIIVPYDVECYFVDWDLFYKEFNALPQSEKKLLEDCGVSLKKVVKQISIRKPLAAGEPSLRLYLALLMQHIWLQESHYEVANRFGVERGWLQATIQSTVAHAAAIAKFAERLPSLWPLRLLLPELVSRLSDCTRTELIPLMKIDHVKRRRAAQLHSGGYKTVAAVAKADPMRMVKELENLSVYQARRMVNSAKSILRDQIDEKVEEMEAMGMEVDQQFVSALQLNNNQMAVPFEVR